MSAERAAERIIKGNYMLDSLSQKAYIEGRS